MIPYMLEYYKMLKKYDINVLYVGPVWGDGIGGAAEALKELLTFNGISQSESQALFSVFIEQLNNILMYAAEKSALYSEDGNPIASNGMFMFGAKGKKYFLQCGNVIKNDGIDLIKNRIERLNSFDKKDLRAYHKEQMKEKNTNPESRGAGLGLTEIARRASSSIEYSFVPFGEGFSFFTMFVTIGYGDIPAKEPFRLEKQKTKATPYVLIDEAAGYIKMEGSSFHENVIEFFDDIYSWLNGFLKSDFKKLTFDCELNYFNSSSSKLLRDMLINMDDHAGGGREVIVNWITNIGNDIIIEYGEDFEEDMKNLTFKIIFR